MFTITAQKTPDAVRLSVMHSYALRGEWHTEPLLRVDVVADVRDTPGRPCDVLADALRQLADRLSTPASRTR